MGLFDKLAGRSEIDLSPRAALLLAAITMVAADGEIDEDEIAIVRRLDKVNDGSWDQALKAWKVYSFDECISRASNALNAEQRLVTIANLVDIAMADGLLAGQEKDLLEAYLGAFELKDSDVEAIVDVISIKNNDTVF